VKNTNKGKKNTNNGKREKFVGKKHQQGQKKPLGRKYL